MIAKVARRGSQMAGLVHYVLGPGKGADGSEKGDVHQDQRVVAMSSDITDVALRRQLSADEENSLSVQLGLYAQMFPQACPQAGSVYHVEFSLPAGEHLDDEQWGLIAEGTAKVLHLERPNGAVGSWAAFCHGESAGGFEHMHFAASLVRSDGSEVRPYLRNGYAELHGVARTAEARYGLSVLAGRDHGSVPTAQRPETEACARRGRAEPERDRLARAVRSAAAGAKTEMDFIDGLRAAEVLVRPRYETGGRTKVVGYSVAVPGERETAKQTRVRETAGRPPARPVWFGGGKLGRVLTLPALRAQWGRQDGHAQAGDDPDTVRRWQRRPSVRFDAAAERDRSARVLAGNKPWVRAGDTLSKLNRLTAESGALGGPEWRRLAREAAGATSGLARRLEVDGPGPLAAASKALARAAQQPVGAPDVADGQRSRMRGVAAVCGQHRLAASGNHAEAWLRVVRELARLADTMQRLAAARSELAVEADLADAARTELRTAHGALRAEWPAHLKPAETTAPHEARGMSDSPRSGLTPGRSVESTGPSLPAPAPEPELDHGNDGGDFGL